MTNDEYELHLTKLILDMAENKDDYLTADSIVRHLALDHLSNKRVIVAAKNIGISPDKMQAAINRRRKQLAKDTQQQEEATAKAEYNAKLQQLCGLEPTTEREFVRGFINTQCTHMDYSLRFYMRQGDKGPVQYSNLLTDIILTAADLRLTKKPLELKDKNFDRALDEHCLHFREQRRQEVCRLICDNPADPDIAQRTRRMFNLLFKEPTFAEAAIRKVIWQIKRKFFNLPIRDHHSVFLLGDQGSGKTQFWSYLKAAIIDLTKNVEISDLIDPAQMDIFRYALIDCDELSRAERANVAKFKSVVTAAFISRRKYYTQNMEDTPMNAVIIGTTNRPLAELFSDDTGMRRFVEVAIKPRNEVPNWIAAVEQFDWLGLWQSTDHNADDPMLACADLLLAKQEAMRKKNRVEEFLDQFEYNASHKTTKGEDGITYPSSVLFKAFKEYEEWACAGLAMSWPTFNGKMKAFIDNKKYPEWSYKTAPRRLNFILQHQPQ